MSELIDTTEMYLRTIYELEEEGVRPLRARITERLSQSGPTVSQTVARMERDGLLTVQDDRHLELSPAGRQHAESVMRRHRLAECLLVEVLGLPISEVHAEACRWEHVMSEQVEERIISLLKSPTVSPFGNPIPGLAKLPTGEKTLSAIAEGTGGQVQISRLDEQLHALPEVIGWLFGAGLTPGSTVDVTAGDGQVVVVTNSERLELTFEQAAHIYVSR